MAVGSPLHGPSGNFHSNSYGLMASAALSFFSMREM
jgi:hypothetical protein